MRTQGEFPMSLPFPAINVFSSPEEVWAMAFHELGQRIKRSFLRQEPHHHALNYVQGLMSDVSRKDGWQVAEDVGEATPYAMQHLLDRAKWDCDGVRDELRTYVKETLATPNGVLVIEASCSGACDEVLLRIFTLHFAGNYPHLIICTVLDGYPTK
jgi:hypothetical protein